MDARRSLIAQWAFDTRAVLQRYHLWLVDVEVERGQDEPVSAYSFAPRGVMRSLCTTAAATALGTRLFGEYGAGVGADKNAFNQAKKAADAISAYVMSEGLWFLTRSLPENHALMISAASTPAPRWPTSSTPRPAGCSTTRPTAGTTSTASCAGAA